MNEDDFFRLLMRSKEFGPYGGIEGMVSPSGQLLDPVLRGGFGDENVSLGLAVPTAEYANNPVIEGSLSAPLLGGLLGISGSYTPETEANEARASYRMENGGDSFGISGLLGDTGFGQKYNEIMADYIKQLEKDEYVGLYGGLRNEKPFIGINYRNRF